MKWIKFFIPPRQIDWNDAMKKFLYDKGRSIVLIDVRQPFEYREQNIKDSFLLPLTEISDRFHELDKNKTFFLFCRSGKRSSLAARILKVKGFENLFNIRGGIKAYNKIFNERSIRN
jgi:rhodanese-related sulfurtransferase